MTPKKPTLTAARKVWLASLKDDRDALAAFWTDEQRRALRNVDWHKVDDSTVQRIADLLRLDAQHKSRF